MKDALSTRALLKLESDDGCMFGTYHKPSDCPGAQTPEAGASGRIGVLFLNSLSTPRAGSGDSAVYWAEALAACGYPCFRFDLPGLGDSYGRLPPEFLSFVMEGGYGDRLKQTIKQLTERFSLSGLVVLGHCAGAVTALHAAAEQACCKGLILMDPRFYLPKSAAAPKLPLKLAVWSRTTALGKVLRMPYDWARSTPITVRRDGLPLNTNLTMLRQWKRAALGGLPILVLTSSETSTQTGQFDYTSFAMNLAGHKARFTLRVIENTDHSFANTAGQDAVKRIIQNWLVKYFPLRAEKASVSIRRAKL